MNFIIEAFYSDLEMTVLEQPYTVRPQAYGLFTHGGGKMIDCPLWTDNLHYFRRSYGS